MAVEDDPAWPEWNDAYDRLSTYYDAYRKLQSLPPDHPDRSAAWAKVSEAQRDLSAAADKIEPALRRN
ncbi:hypothetical protein V1282_003521 [Nitrobacteraceae bacterium AZCC 2146]